MGRQLQAPAHRIGGYTTNVRHAASPRAAPLASSWLGGPEHGAADSLRLAGTARVGRLPALCRLHRCAGAPRAPAGQQRARTGLGRGPLQPQMAWWTREGCKGAPAKRGRPPWGRRQPPAASTPPAQRLHLPPRLQPVRLGCRSLRHSRPTTASTWMPLRARLPGRRRQQQRAARPVRVRRQLRRPGRFCKRVAACLPARARCKCRPQSPRARAAARLTETLPSPVLCRAWRRLAGRLTARAAG